MNPRNGLCLNAIHHRAFDEGLMTITPDMRVRLSSRLAKDDDAIQAFFGRYENQPVRLPRRFLPDPILLKWHSKRVFVP